MANCQIAAVHSTGRRQWTRALRIARNSNFSAASSSGSAACLDDFAQAAIERPPPGSSYRSSCGSPAGKRRTAPHAASRAAKPGRSPDSACPFVLEGIELDLRGLGRFRPVDCLQIGHDQLAVLPQHEGQRIADQMDDASLHRGHRKHRADRFGEALRFREGRLLSPSTTVPWRRSASSRTVNQRRNGTRNQRPIETHTDG